MSLETQTRMIAMVVLGVPLLLVMAHRAMPSSSTIASTGTSAIRSSSVARLGEPGMRRNPDSVGITEMAPQGLPPAQYTHRPRATEQIAVGNLCTDILLSTPLLTGSTNPRSEATKDGRLQALPLARIPITFFGFANEPGKGKRIFLSMENDIFIAGEGEIVDRRYKVLRISQSSVQLQDVVDSGAPQTIPLSRE